MTSLINNLLWLKMSNIKHNAVYSLKMQNNFESSTLCSNNTDTVPESKKWMSKHLEKHFLLF